MSDVIVGLAIASKAIAEKIVNVCDDMLESEVALVVAFAVVWFICGFLTAAVLV